MRKPLNLHLSPHPGCRIHLFDLPVSPCRRRRCFEVLTSGTGCGFWKLPCLSDKKIDLTKINDEFARRQTLIRHHQTHKSAAAARFIYSSLSSQKNGVIHFSNSTENLYGGGSTVQNNTQFGITENEFIAKNKSKRLIKRIYPWQWSFPRLSFLRLIIRKRISLLTLPVSAIQATHWMKPPEEIL